MAPYFKPWPDIEPKNILIRMPNWLGDLVMATPILHDIRKKWPQASITAMCQSNTGTLIEKDPNLNEIYSFKKPSGWIHQSNYSHITEALKNGEYDLGVLLTNSFSSAWWFWRGNIKNRIGFKGNFRNLLLNKAVPFPKNREIQHLVITYKSLLEPLGIPVSSSPPSLYVSEEEKKSAERLLSEKSNLQPSSFSRLHKNQSPQDRPILIGINPGAAYGSAKCWLPDRFHDVTKKLLKDPNIIVAYFGDTAGAPLVNEICKGFDSRVINFAGKTTLRELLALIQSCSVMLTNDSGPMHIASALNVPLVALFGSTSDVQTGPYGGGIIIHKHVECSPCYKRVCPIDFRCMKQIEVDEVYEAIIKQLQAKKVA